MLNVDILNAYCTDSLGHAEHCPSLKLIHYGPLSAMWNFVPFLLSQLFLNIITFFLYRLFGCLKSNLKELGVAMAAPVKHSLNEGWFIPARVNEHFLVMNSGRKWQFV